MMQDIWYGVTARWNEPAERNRYSGGESLSSDGRVVTARLYGELAAWWPLLSAPADYAEEAAFFKRLLLENRERLKPTV